MTIWNVSSKWLYVLFVVVYDLHVLFVVVYDLYVLFVVVYDCMECV